MSENPYAAPANFDAPPPVGRDDYPELDTKSLKRLRNSSHSLDIAATLLFLCTIGLAISLFRGGSWLLFSSPVLAFLCVSTHAFVFRPKWGRIPGFFSATMMLAGFPVGTLIGIFALIALATSPQLFGPGRYEHKRLEAEWKYRRKNGVE